MATLRTKEEDSLLFLELMVVVVVVECLLFSSTVCRATPKFVFVNLLPKRDSEIERQIDRLADEEGRKEGRKDGKHLILFLNKYANCV